MSAIAALSTDQIFCAGPGASAPCVKRPTVAAEEMFRLFPLVAFDGASESQFQHLRASRLRVGTLDLKIAAIALTNGLTVLTRNLSDFGRVPGLALEDWSV